MTFHEPKLGTSAPFKRQRKGVWKWIPHLHDWHYWGDPVMAWGPDNPGTLLRTCQICGRIEGAIQ